MTKHNALLIFGCSYTTIDQHILARGLNLYPYNSGYETMPLVINIPAMPRRICGIQDQILTPQCQTIGANGSILAAAVVSDILIYTYCIIGDCCGITLTLVATGLGFCDVCSKLLSLGESYALAGAEMQN